jgi:hypothetical protein
MADSGWQSARWDCVSHSRLRIRRSAARGRRRLAGQPGRPHRWEVSWLPGRIVDRNTAITAMILADTAAEEDLHEGHRLWPHLQTWAEQLGLTGPDAIARASQPPRGLDLSRNAPADSPIGRQRTDQPARHRIQIARQQRGTRRWSAGGRTAARPVPVRASDRPRH